MSCTKLKPLNPGLRYAIGVLRAQTRNRNRLSGLEWGALDALAEALANSRR